MLAAGFHDVRIVNAVVHDNKSSRGGGLYAEDASCGSCAFEVVNGTFAFNSAASGGAGMYIESTIGSGSRVTNTIVYSNPGTSSAQEDDLFVLGVVDMPNCFLGKRSAGSADPGSSQGPWIDAYGFSPAIDPRWVSPAARNFRLKSDSPCIEQGSDLLLTVDLTDVDLDGNYLNSGNELMPREHFMGDEAFLGSTTMTTREAYVSGSGGAAALGINIGVDGGYILGAITDIGAYEHRVYAAGQQ